MKIKVTYVSNGKINMLLDEKIRKFFKRLGYKWTGQGTNFTTGIRDMCFEEVKNEPQS